MPIDELVAFLRSWTPGNDIDEPTAEGLARQLAAAVTAEPQRYADEAGRFENLDPTYVRAFAQGLLLVAALPTKPMRPN